MVSGWSSCVYSRHGCSLCDVQCSRGFATATARRHMEQRMVPVVGIRGNQLYAQLGIRMLRCARFLDRSVSLNDLPSAQLAPARSRRVKDYGLNIAERQLVQSESSDWPALKVLLELRLGIAKRGASAAILNRVCSRGREAGTLLIESRGLPK